MPADPVRLRLPVLLVVGALTGGAAAWAAPAPAKPAGRGAPAPARQAVPGPAAPNPAALRAAARDLMETFGGRYPDGGAHLEELGRIEARLARADPTATADLERLARRALLANPLVAGQPLLFVARHQYARDHHNTATFFPAAEKEYNDGRFKGGGAIKVLDVRTGKATTLLDLPEGVARDPEVHFDGKKILFSMRRDAKDSYHLYEIRADGTGLTQLSRAADVDDLDPLYLPDGDVAFSSTREPKYCACNRHIMANLFRMHGDGANVHQIGRSTLFEGHGALMPDGRILYDRWEYVDRNFGDAQGLWTVNPDGTNPVLFWGNNTPSPGGILDARIIPGTGWAVCTFGSCHDRPWGAIAIVDPARGLDGKAPVVRTWPADAVDLVRDPGTANNAWDLFGRLKLKYEDPYPLAEAGTNRGAGKYFLCAKMTGDGEQTGVYLIDVFGNEVQVYAEPRGGPGCFDPMPVGARERPSVMAERRDLGGREGTMYVQDVYRGTHMAGVERGSVKALRVVEVPEKRFWTKPGWNGQGFEGPAMNWHDFNFKRVLGTVPVEADGSAYFTLPAETFVYFQLLDGEGQMVQSMRSGTSVRGGERASCVGCHEDRRTAPPSGASMPMALRRPPSRLEGWQGPARGFNYLAEVQPVWDRQCVSCHDYEHQPTAKVNLARDRGLAFNASYAELWSKKLVTVAGAGPAEILQARSWGSHPSRLVQVLREGHYGVKLTSSEMDRVVTWVDLNAPYYPSFATGWPENAYGRAPLDGKEMARLAELAGRKVDRPQLVSFDRPEKSPLLEPLKRDAAKHEAALAIVRRGAEALARNPNPDAEGFVACETDRWREEKYAKRQEAEARAREAVRTGEKRYDGEGR